MKCVYVPMPSAFHRVMAIDTAEGGASGTSGNGPRGPARRQRARRQTPTTIATARAAVRSSRIGVLHSVTASSLRGPEFRITPQIGTEARSVVDRRFRPRAEARRGPGRARPRAAPSSLISPRSRRSRTASRSAEMTERRISSCSISSTCSGVRSSGSLSVGSPSSWMCSPRCSYRSLQLVDQRQMSRHLAPHLLESSECGLGGHPPRVGLLARDASRRPPRGERGSGAGSVSPCPMRVTRITLKVEEDDQAAARERLAGASIVSGARAPRPGRRRRACRPTRG